MTRGRQIATTGSRHSLRAVTISSRDFFVSLGSAKPMHTSATELAEDRLAAGRHHGHAIRRQRRTTGPSTRSRSTSTNGY